MNFVNKITIARILIIPLFILSFVYYKPGTPFFSALPLVIFLAATISDGIDGFIARTFKQKTKLGAILDPIADKLLIITAFICLSVVGNLPKGIRFPAWVPLVVISRDVIIMLGSVVIYLLKGDLNIKPSGLGKATTFLQMATVISVFLQFEFSPFIWSVMAFFTIASGVDYVRKGSMMLNGNHK